MNYRLCANFIFIIVLKCSHGSKYRISSVKSFNEFNNISLTISDHCFVADSQPALILSNWSDPTLHKFHFQTEPKLVILIGIDNSDTLTDYSSKVNYRLLNPLSIKLQPAKQVYFVLFDVISLKLALYKLKESVYWNISGLYFIQNTNSANTCSQAYSFLKLMWEFNILSVTYICREMDLVFSLYTFNPYNQDAPEAWKQESIHKERNKHPLTLFKQTYNIADFSKNLNKICTTLNFDKTLKVSGYPIKICGEILPSHATYDSNRSDAFKFRGISGEIAELVWSKLEANVTEEVIKEIKDFSTGKCDTHVNFFYQTDYWQKELNLHYISGLCYVMTKEYMTIGEQFLSIFPPRFWLLIFVFYTFIVFIFMRLLKQKLSQAVLDVLRGMLGMSTLKRPKHIGRILFMYLVCFFMLLSTFLQSQLTSMLTTATHYKHVETLEDMIKYNYNIQAADFYRNFFNESINKYIQRVHHFKNCFNNMKENDKTVCINDCEEIQFFTRESKKIHIVKDLDFVKYCVVLFRDNFPLLNRVRDLFYRMIEQGVVFHLMNMQVLKYKHREKESEPKKLSCYQLRFAFYLLLLGSLFSIFLFFIELIIKFLTIYVPHNTFSFYMKSRKFI